ncbi:hypothetical protein KXV74_006672, partial [Aspergillus fumigatus]
EWKSPVSNSYRDYNKDDLDKHQDVWYHDFFDNADHDQQGIHYNHHVVVQDTPGQQSARVDGRALTRMHITHSACNKGGKLRNNR